METGMKSSSRPQLWPEIRLLLLAAMVFFAYTIVIGILNGADIIDFDRRRILGHVHAGTLGWLTLAVFAASYWLFGDSEPITDRERQGLRLLAGLAIVAFALSVVAFTVTYGNWRAASGVLALLPIIGVTGWVLWRARKTVLGVPHWGFLAALGTSIAGGVIGVLLGLQIATGNKFLPTGGEDAHPGTMVVGFLIPMGLALSEWAFFFPRPPKATRLGIIQMAFPFAGGILLMLSILLDITPLAPLAILLQVAGLIIFYKRMWGPFRAIDWSKASPGRYALASALSGIFVLGLALFLSFRYEGDFDLAPVHQMIALDHGQTTAVMTNAIFAMLLAATVAGGRGNRNDQAVFLMMNIGIIGFTAGLLFDVTILKQIFAPLMGVGLLLGLGLYGGRLLLAADAEEVEAPAERELAMATGD
jgi:hypothetical protein